MRPVVQPVEALLAVDVGNTRIGMAVWDDDGLHASRRVELQSPELWSEALGQAWSETGAARERAVVIAGVSPRQVAQLSEVVREVCDLEPLRVREDLPLPMDMEIVNPSEVGVDRVCSCAAAYERVQRACAVASFGTAITVDCVSPDGKFLGGAILPGFNMCYEALHDGTALLPRVDARPPNGPFGRNTHDAIINGVTYGAVGALREIVERFATELREWPQLVITGGNAPIIRDLADFVDSLVPDLCLMGVALAYRKAAGQV